MTVEVSWNKVEEIMARKKLYLILWSAGRKFYIQKVFLLEQKLLNELKKNEAYQYEFSRVAWDAPFAWTVFCKSCIRAVAPRYA